MKTCKNLYSKLYSIDNLKLAFTKARKGKTLRLEVIKFEKNLNRELPQLKNELKFLTYKPKPLVNFIIRDPKIRKISKSHFRDRVVHHALCNLITPIFEKTFILDSYANQIDKGTLAAIQRFDYFKRKVTKNNTKNAYVFKADIRKYFESINHEILTNTIKKKIKDRRIIWLIQIILNNSTGGGANRKRAT
ncbi:MAG: reverse transcriptase domain-containing protein [archaeon]